MGHVKSNYSTTNQLASTFENQFEKGRFSFIFVLNRLSRWTIHGIEGNQLRISVCF